MAQLTNSILGNISGKLGDVVFRKVNGKTVICSRPKSFTPDSSLNGISRRNKFAVNSLFAAAANKIPVIKSIWQYFLSAYPYVANNPYNAISKLNYKHLSNEEISDRNFLAPQIGFQFHITNANLTSKNLIISTEPLSPSFYHDSILFINKFVKNKDPLSQKTNLHIAVLILANNPVTVVRKSFLFLPLTSSVENANLLSNQSFSIPIDSITSQTIAQYASLSLITALIITTKDNTPITNSITLHTPLS